MREKILEDLNPLIADFIVKAKSGRIKDKELAKIRISYANSLANLIRAYNGLLKDKELEELYQKMSDKDTIISNQQDNINQANAALASVYNNGYFFAVDTEVDEILGGGVGNGDKTVGECGIDRSRHSPTRSAPWGDRENAMPCAYPYGNSAEVRRHP